MRLYINAFKIMEGFNGVASPVSQWSYERLLVLEQGWDKFWEAGIEVGFLLC
jgi:hypothetical protein